MVVPVGDLAVQVHKVFSDYCRNADLRVSAVFSFLSNLLLFGAHYDSRRLDI